jgi:hypothetical protein
MKKGVGVWSGEDIDGEFIAWFALMLAEATDERIVEVFKKRFSLFGPSAIFFWITSNLESKCEESAWQLAFIRFFVQTFLKRGYKF